MTSLAESSWYVTSVAEEPLATLEILRLNVKFAIGLNFAGGPYFSHSVGVAVDLFTCHDMAILDLQKCPWS